jgi:hypothetical protein
MAQRIMVMHGRNIKPACAPYKEQQLRALINGVERDDPAKAEKIRNGTVTVEFIYYGDINNRILHDLPRYKGKLTATDPEYGNADCMPVGPSAEGVDRLLALKNFGLATYRKILRENKDQRWLDEAAWLISSTASILSLNWANEKVIELATADMGAYLLKQSVGSEIRTRLQAPLIEAFESGDDICLVGHSMGTIVSYDVLWKFSHMSEYAHVRAMNPMVSLWLTLGCPLGEPGVYKNLYDANENGKDKYPRGIVRDWVNIAARDDFVAHDKTVANDFREMKKFGFVESIRDYKINNCYTREGESDPHNIYGYLANNRTGAEIAKWID